MKIKVAVIGIRFLFTMSIDVSPAISEVAISTPETGEIARPIEAASCIGTINAVELIPICVAKFGTKGPNEKNAAFPLPISIEAKYIINVNIIPIPTPAKPTEVVSAMSPSINCNEIRPLAKNSAHTIKVTTDLKILPIPSQKTESEANNDLKFLCLIASKINDTKRLKNITVEVSKVIFASVS